MLMRMLAVSERPLWMLASVCFLLWMLIETVYNWFAISALSHSGLSPFPSFQEGFKGGEWPASRSFIDLRETLRREHFHLSGSTVGRIGDNDVLRGCFYDSEDEKLRIHVMFMPTPGGYLQSFFTVSSLLDDGCRVVTDNIFLPFGGFYPEDMILERRPLIRTLNKLLAYHARRLKRIGRANVAWKCNPVEDLNRQQSELEQLNIRLGFLIDPAHREELGNISREGRYRIWKEIWMLNYFGKPFSY